MSTFNLMKKNMKTLSSLLLIAGILTGLYSCSNDKGPVTPKTPVQISLNQHQKDLVVSNNAFAFNIFKTIMSAESNDKNVFISPLSISLALAMTYNGANGDTKTQMQNTLQFPDLSTEDINGYFQKITTSLLQVDPKINLRIANSIWYEQSFSVLPAFIQVNQDYYSAQVQGLDFNNPASVNTINKWVSDKTNSKIPKVIDQIDPQTIMFLINAIYFKGNWSSEFDKNGTHNLSFTLSDASTISTPMMHQKGSFNYFSNDQFAAVEMPYGQGNFTMLVFLPNEGQGTNDIVTSLSADNWDSWLNNFSKQTVDITFPRFKFEYERFLNDDLISLGMPKAFSPIEADFTNINSNGGLYISYVKHNSFVEVNETGTEAAAVTTVAIGATMVGPNPTYYTFLVNRPFLFAIRETTTDAILFIGKVSNPQ
jgi:serine protease inhibitor